MDAPSTDPARRTAVPFPKTGATHHFDHLSPELALDLHATLATMRERCPVARSDQHGGFWIVTRYDDVLRVAQDWQTFSSAHGVSVPARPSSARRHPRAHRPAAAPQLQAADQRRSSPAAAVAPYEATTRATS